MCSSTTMANTGVLRNLRVIVSEEMRLTLCFKGQRSEKQKESFLEKGTVYAKPLLLVLKGASGQ